jgi:hypothetical protein
MTLRGMFGAPSPNVRPQTAGQRHLLLSLSIAGLAVACTAPADDAGASGMAAARMEQGDDGSIPLLGGGGSLSSATSIAAFDNIADYRIGDEFGKKPVTEASLSSATDPFRRAARATAMVGGATGFYLGKFAGVHVMATNHHVYTSMSCAGRAVTFPLLGNLRFPCTKMFGTWTEIDLALFAIDVPHPEDEAKLAAVAANFTFYDDIQKGAPLITIGFGIAGNAQRVMMGNEDADCRVMSKTGEYEFMGDPDAKNPADYKAWSFSHACDVSHGDSGSAMVDRASGRPVGILWTGKIPKDSRVQSSAYLDQVLASDGADVWSEMNYAVPATKMREHLADVIAASDTPADTRTVLQALIAPN